MQPDLHSYNFENDPEPTLKWLQENDPVHWSQHGYWFVTRYEDVKTVLSDPATFSSQKAGFGSSNPISKDGKGNANEKAMASSLALSFNQQDPPDHTRVRMLVNSAFSRKEISERSDRIHQLSEDLLTQARAKGAFDLVTDFAFHLPIIVASEIIGIPPEDREQFRRTFEHAARLMAPKRSEESWAEALKGAKWQGSYMKTLLAERMREPKQDLISALIEASDDDDTLSPGEIASAILTIFTAAGTTTERTISSGAYLLLKHPDQLAAFKSDPSLMDNLLEEILRFHHPNQSTSTNRRATADVVLGGKTIREGDTVRVSLGAANRDPQAFDEPNRFDITRKNQKHLSFGHGIHFCLGSALARYEAKAAFQSLFLGPGSLALLTNDPVKDPERPDRYREIMVHFA